MQFKKLHPEFILPTRASEGAGGYDLYMPEKGTVHLHDVPGKGELVGLGFAAAVPEGYVALILPRSGAGAKYGIELRNTCGVIDSDYRGEWKVAVKCKEGLEFSWAAGERLFQYILVPVAALDPVLVEELEETKRGGAGFGSTGQ